MELSGKEQKHIALVRMMERLGFPTEFGEVIAESLGTEKQMERMIAWLGLMRPTTPEMVADEMLAIKAEFERYREKKVAEYCNSKYNEIMRCGLENDD